MSGAAIAPADLSTRGAGYARHTGGLGVGRPDDDFYPTPPIAVTKLLAAETFEGGIWEPAAGDGAIVRVLQEAGHEVTYSDLHDRGYGGGTDFLTAERQVVNIITNPPYKMAAEFIDHALDCTTGKVAMLLRLAFLEGAMRRVKFEGSWPLARVHVFSKRLTMHRNGIVASKSGGCIAFCWMVFEHGHKGSPTIGWI
jgi:hypothetical protein